VRSGFSPFTFLVSGLDVPDPPGFLPAPAGFSLTHDRATRHASVPGVGSNRGVQFVAHCRAAGPEGKFLPPTRPGELAGSGEARPLGPWWALRPARSRTSAICGVGRLAPLHSNGGLCEPFATPGSDCASCLAGITVILPKSLAAWVRGA
jgi:hypothetical protein